MPLSGRVFISGASRGLGLEMVRQLVARSSVSGVVAGVRSPDKAKELAALAEEAGHRLHVLRLDVADDKSIAHAAEETASVVGAEGLSVLINNAGILPNRPSRHFPDITRKELQEVYGTNVFGAVLLTQALLGLLKKASPGPGLVANLSTELATPSGYAHQIGAITGLPYISSKAALNLASRVLAEPLRRAGKVVCVAACPGVVATDIHPTGPVGTKVEAGVAALLNNLDAVTKEHSGHLINKKGTPVKV